MAKKKTAYNIRDKTRMRQNYIDEFLNQAIQYFQYRGLPDTIPSRIFELMLRTNGNVFAMEHNGKPYIFTGGLGGELNQYYEPTIYTVANPYFNISKNAKIGIDGVLIRNNSTMASTIELMEMPIALLTENAISMYNALINTRTTNIFTAGTTQAKQSAERYIEQIEQGKNAILADNPFVESLKIQNVDRPSGNIQNMIETNQYLKSELANINGFDYTFNLKRERLNIPETQKGREAVHAIALDMLKCRQEGLTKFNEMFGTNATVEINPDLNPFCEEAQEMEVDQYE